MIVTAKDIQVSFKKENQETLFGKKRQQILYNVCLEVNKGECLGLIGESGSGKSTLGRVLSGLLKPDSGKVIMEGIDLYGKHTKAETLKLRHKTSIVFQDYTSSVNPRFRVYNILEEALRSREKSEKIKIDKKFKSIELLEKVGLDESFINRYPHELSGGQLQRVCIARALAIEPKVIIFDEATSSLDASTQTQVMNLLAELRDKYHFSYIFITHDLTAITYLCDKVLFMYNGKIVEQVDDICDLTNIHNDYAKKLLASVIDIDIRPDWISSL